MNLNILEDLMLAVHYEHQARTGHDAFAQDKSVTCFCNVCLFLSKTHEQIEDARRVEMLA